MHPFSKWSIIKPSHPLYMDDFYFSDIADEIIFTLSQIDDQCADLVSLYDELDDLSNYTKMFEKDNQNLADLGPMFDNKWIISI